MQNKLTTKGPYKEIPGTKGLTVNKSGFVKTKSGKLKLPGLQQQAKCIRYTIEFYNKPTMIRRTKLIRTVWGEKITTMNDTDIWKEMREMAEQENARMKPKNSTAPKNGTKPKRNYQNKPCPDGRSFACEGYLPEGYHVRCPECWKLVREYQGLEMEDFTGGMVNMV